MNDTITVGFLEPAIVKPYSSFTACVDDEIFWLSRFHVACPIVVDELDPSRVTTAVGSQGGPKDIPVLAISFDSSYLSRKRLSIQSIP